MDWAKKWLLTELKYLIEELTYLNEAVRYLMENGCVVAPSKAAAGGVALASEMAQNAEHLIWVWERVYAEAREHHGSSSRSEGLY